SIAEAQKFFGLPRGITRDMFDIIPLPSTEAQKRFVERFEAIEAMRVVKTGNAAGGVK
ncbi:MAG TPA: hydrolase, partial [Agrobacterium sp.]|nr:hydrolase [Agrobacterium sp.]